MVTASISYGGSQMRDQVKLLKVFVLLATFLAAFGVPAWTAPLTVHIYVADRGNSRIVQMNDISGAGWIVHGTSGSGVKQFSFPRGLFVDTAGRIYVADTDNHRIVRMNDISGEGWMAVGSAGGGPKQFNKPRGVFVDKSGKIYVADAGNHRIVRMDEMSGAGWITFGAFSGGTENDKPGNLIDPGAIFVEAMGRVYIADIGSGYDLRRIIRIDDMSGAGWTPFGTWGKGVNRFDSPGSVFVDPAGKIYVADTANHRIVRINDMSGAGWTALGTQGSGANQLNLPSGIFVDAAGRIYIADVLNSRVVRMSDMTGSGWVTLGSAGSGANQFSLPASIFVR